MTRKRGGVKRGESNLASNQFPKCSPQPRTPRASQLSRDEKGEKGKSHLGEKRESQKRREQSSQ